MEQIDAKKAKLLEDFKSLAEGKSSEQMIPLVLAFTDKAKKENISFTKEEISIIFKEMNSDMA